MLLITLKETTGKKIKNMYNLLLKRYDMSKTKIFKKHIIVKTYIVLSTQNLKYKLEVVY